MTPAPMTPPIATPEQQPVLDRAAAAASRLGDTAVRPPHLLIALADDDGPAGRRLRAAGLDAAGLATTVRELVDRRGGLTDDDVAALTAVGVDVDAIRAQAEAVFGPNALARRRGTARMRPREPRKLALAGSARSVLAAAAAIAALAAEPAWRPPHLLAALLDRGGPSVSGALTTHGIRRDAVLRSP
jgi:Clp amino terminal domain, pathogenicity island component